MSIYPNTNFIVNNHKPNLRFIPYVGNKSGYADIFDKLIPDKFSKLVFYDIFGGSSSFSIYACNRFGAKNVVYNDNNFTVVNLVKTLRDNPKGLILEFRKHHARSSSEYYYYIRDLDLNDGVIGAGRFFYLAKNAFSGKIRFNSKGKFSCSMRKVPKSRDINEKTLLYISSVIKDLTIKNESFEYFYDVKNSFLYLDPPFQNNPNRHYNQQIKYNNLMEFVKKIQLLNKLMISEQDSLFLNFSYRFTIYNVYKNKSLQYFKRKINNEIIAINYFVP